jgi:arylsulfatase A-like enzyme
MAGMKFPIVCLTATLSCLLAAPAPAAEPPRKPNILVIIADDMGYADAGFQGCTDIPTPHLDALAREGVRCTNGYVTGPYCSPTRAALLTGRAQTRFGHEFNPSGPRSGLPLTEKTLADRLKSAGYRTALIGKWHLGAAPEFHPLKRGFDEFYGFLGGAHSYSSPDGIFRGTEPVSEISYTTDAFAREAESFIDRHAANPWFLCLSFNAVHTPMHATEERLRKFSGISDPQRRTYAAMLSAMDDAIGSVRARLAARELTSNTLIAFFSDNGGPVMRGVTVNGASNAPLRGSKRTTLEGGIRVPFLIAWPSHLKPSLHAEPVVQTDVHATALAAAGITPAPGWKLEGTNLIPHFTSDQSAPPHAALFWRFGQQMAVRKGPWKLVRYDTTADGLPPGISPSKLYNLADDPGESKDLASSQPEKVSELQALWDAWDKDNAKPLWGSDHPNPGKARRRNP